jgi:hypothetical protein
MKTLNHILKTAIVFVVVIVPLNIYSLCVTPFEEGNWQNIDGATRGITKVNVTFNCQDVVLNGELYPPGPPFKIHMFGKCHPSDCDWGVADAHRVTIGSTNWIRAYYDHSFARRYVYIKPSTLYPGKLFMWMYTDFSDAARPDYILRNWFYK